MKRKLKKKVKNFFFVILFLFILVFFIFTFIKPEQKENKVVEINYVLEILKMENNVFEKEFLEWVDDNYDNVSKKLFDSLKNNTYTDNFWHSEVGYSYKVVNDLYNGGYGEIDNVTFVQENKEVATIGFAGDVSLADNWTIMPKYKSRNQGVLGILSQNMINYMSSLDWMNVNSEFAFSNRGVAMAGKQYTFRANSVHANIYHEMGVDMVALANNHVYDYGQEAFYDTLSTLQNYKIPYIGAGVNKEEAERAYYLIVIRFRF